jgi:hypothetical protein
MSEDGAAVHMSPVDDGDRRSDDSGRRVLERRFYTNGNTLKRARENSDVDNGAHRFQTPAPAARQPPPHMQGQGQGQHQQGGHHHHNGVGNGVGAPRDKSNYHFYAFCNARNASVNTYESACRLLDEVRSGAPISERRLAELVTSLSDRLCCVGCGKYCPQVNNSVFVGRCAHVTCKPSCFDRMGARCPICPPPPSYKN